jgi:hypothetical protein
MEEDLITKKYRDRHGYLKVGTLVAINTTTGLLPEFNAKISSHQGTHFGNPLYGLSNKKGKWTEKYMTVLGSLKAIKIKNIKI